VPDISVVIPTYSRPDRLRQCLKSLAHSTAKSFEVIVVDDGSPDPVAATVNTFTNFMDVRCHRQANAGPAAARNAGAALARGRFLAFTDDDCRPEPEWIANITEPLRTKPEALVGGQTKNIIVDNIYSEASQDLICFLYEWAGQKKHGFDFFASNNIACCRQSFSALGGFDASFPLAAAEDRDFGLRWKDKTWPLIFEERAVIGHAHDLNFAKFFWQQSNYGRGAKHLRSRAASRNAPPVAFEGLRFYLHMARYPFRMRRPNALSRSMLLAFSQVAMTAGFVRETLRKP
jgi:glycosyltransferase involved in cell wall biosynthesis